MYTFTSSSVVYWLHMRTSSCEVVEAFGLAHTVTVQLAKYVLKNIALT